MSERSSEIVFSDFSQMAVDRIGVYLDELASRDAARKVAAANGRDAVKSLLGIYRVDGAGGEAMAAVDSSSILDDGRVMSMAIAAAVRYGGAESPKPLYNCVFLNDSLSAIGSPSLLRLSLELELLSDVTDYTIMDNSFWSVLIECNQIATKHGDGTIRFDGSEDMVSKLILERDNLLLDVLSNSKVVAMSKQHSASSIAERIGGEMSKIKDRELMTIALREGEFTAPAALGDLTNAQFGVHRALADSQRISDTYSGELMLTFYKPWEYKPAYRIEFNRNAIDELESILLRVKADTSTYAGIEPDNQMMADRISKSALSTIDLFKTAASVSYPHLLDYRS